MLKCMDILHRNWFTIIMGELQKFSFSSTSSEGSMSTVKSKKLQVGTDATSSNNFTIYQPATPDGTLRIGVGNADNPTEVGRFDSNGYVATNAPAFSAYINTSTNY
jgi:hypothetical protein